MNTVLASSCSSLKQIRFISMYSNLFNSDWNYYLILRRTISRTSNAITYLPCSSYYCRGSSLHRITMRNLSSKPSSPSDGSNNIYSKEVKTGSLSETNHSSNQNSIEMKNQLQHYKYDHTVSSKDINIVLQNKVEDWSDKLKNWYKFYQDAVGISEVCRAQEKVTELIDSMSIMSSRRIELQRELAELHQSLNSVHSRITNSPRYSEEHTLLFDQARQLNTTLQSTKREFELLENRERDCLTRVMSAVRVSHEIERTQQQHTNYRTVALSLVSAAIAAVVTFITNLKRTKDTNSRIHKTELHASTLHEDAKHHMDSLETGVKLHVTAINDTLLRKLDTILPNNFGQPSLDENISQSLFITQLNQALENFYSKSAPNYDKSLLLNTSVTEDISVDTEIPNNSSIYRISIYMATGAILGTLMTAVLFGVFS